MARHARVVSESVTVVLLAVGILWFALPAGADDCPAAPVDLAERLRGGVQDESVFGVARAEVPWVFYPGTQARALPADFGPGDLVRTSAGSAPQGSMPVRRLIVPDLEAMFAAARADGVVFGIVS